MPNPIDTRATKEGPAGPGADAATAEPDPFIGALVADRYRVERRLGEGGIGRVYRATQLQLGRAVALKLLHPELCGRKEIVQRFEREARAASRLSHPGSVMVFDFGSWNGRLYLAMELVEGRSLDEVIKSGGPLEPERAIDLGAQLCEALQAAHAQGLLHRDLKPENILLMRAVDGREIVKICDYGLAYLIDDEGKSAPRLTREGSVAGTPEFMAPEQVLNRPLDARTDLYALGCVLYEMLAGTPPFQGASPMEILTRQLYDDPEPLARRARRPVPRALEQVVSWALQKVPANRPQGAAELRAALLATREATTGLVAGQRAERPTPDEVEVLRDRRARTLAAGIAAPPTRPSAEHTPIDAEVVVVAAAELPFDRSAVAVLRAQGIATRSVPSLDEAVGVEAIVIDVREGGIEPLAARVLELAGRACLVAVGRDDDFASMTRALELKVADYVPESLLPSLPRKLQRALDRARRNRA